MTTQLFDFTCAVVAKGALLLLCALAAVRLCKRAAQRHQILSLAVIGLLALPLVSFVLPAYTPRIVPAGTLELDPEFGSASAEQELAAPYGAALWQPGTVPGSGDAGHADPHRDRPAWLLLLLGLGAGVTLLRMVPGWLGVRRLLRGALPLTVPEWQQLLDEGRQQLGIRRRVRLYHAQVCRVPLTFGVVRPVVLLPADCAQWPAARRRLVLLHELAHVKRQDCLLQLLGQLACAVHWFNPLAWRVERLLRSERELAADALVLASGVRPSAYADELLAVARTLSARPERGMPLAVAMAGSSQLAGRLNRILDPRADLRPLGWRFKLAAVALALALLLPLGALHGWASVPADSKAAARTQDALRVQVASHFMQTRGERPVRIELTLSPIAQALIEEELDTIAQKFRPAGASIVALDPRSGAILGLGSRGGDGRNLAVEQAYEPASTLKVFSVAAALDAGTIAPAQSFSTESGDIQSSGAVVRDVTPAATLTVADILALSSNIGAIKIYRTLGRDGLVRALGRFHFGERPDLQIPAAAGTAPRSDGTDSQAEAAAFGHGLLVSPLQLAAAFAAVANHGVYHHPRLVQKVVGPGNAVLFPEARQPEQVLKPETAETLLRMLEGVVHRNDGTGTSARMAGYRVAGKTGTGKHTGLFVGAAPAEDPRLVLLVVVDGPEGAGQSYFGNTVAAPSFRRIAEKLLPELHTAGQSPRAP